ncbi:hypothetical protein Hypma_009320 [Hypsizygus marmoreus]|uniref:Uncharacterized protein n=1 Tax=Hypsizygus marmoreus TaxID=39966 RepID=A0A369JQZ4_HYPMA|nr:hypothetical protein Hypma_009320 [Hypsizygus marmoreus]
MHMQLSFAPARNAVIDVLLLVNVRMWNTKPPIPRPMSPAIDTTCSLPTLFSCGRQSSVSSIDSSIRDVLGSIRTDASHGNVIKTEKYYFAYRGYESRFL